MKTSTALSALGLCGAAAYLISKDPALREKVSGSLAGLAAGALNELPTSGALAAAAKAEAQFLLNQYGSRAKIKSQQVTRGQRPPSPADLEAAGTRTITDAEFEIIE